jgi:hypothetical protein
VYSPKYSVAWDGQDTILDLSMYQVLRKGSMTAQEVFNMAFNGEQSRTLAPGERLIKTLSGEGWELACKTELAAA